MAPVAIALMVVGSAIQASNTIAGGKAAAAAGKAQQAGLDYQASQLDIAAGQERAKAQHAGLEKIRQADLVGSRALALSAASGGGAMDPTVIKIMGDIVAEGDYRSRLAGYEGELNAQGLESRAVVARYQGEQARIAGNVARKSANMTALSTIFSSAGKAMMGGYGGGAGAASSMGETSSPGPAYGYNSPNASFEYYGNIR